MLLENRVALVTGASRGIGAASRGNSGSHGAAVGVNYLRNAEAADQVVASITAAGGRAVAVQGDTRDPEQTASMVAEATAALGPIDTLVVNAAMDFPVAPFLEFAWPDFEAKLVGELRRRSTRAKPSCRA